HVAHLSEAKSIQLFQNFHTRTHYDMIRIEHMPHTVSVVVSFRQIFFPVVCTEQRLQAVIHDHLVCLIVTIFAAAYRHDTVVVALLLLDDLGNRILEKSLAIYPELVSESIKFLRDPARGTNTLLVSAQIDRY